MLFISLHSYVCPFPLDEFTTGTQGTVCFTLQEWQARDDTGTAQVSSPYLQEGRMGTVSILIQLASPLLEWDPNRVGL